MIWASLDRGTAARPSRGERLVLRCDHGSASSLAAAPLLELGVDAADVIGGFEAWAAAGLPVERRPRPWTGGTPGTGPPDERAA